MCEKKKERRSEQGGAYLYKAVKTAWCVWGTVRSLPGTNKAASPLQGAVVLLWHTTAIPWNPYVLQFNSPRHLCVSDRHPSATYNPKPPPQLSCVVSSVCGPACLPVAYTGVNLQGSGVQHRERRRDFLRDVEREREEAGLPRPCECPACRHMLLFYLEMTLSTFRLRYHVNRNSIGLCFLLLLLRNCIFFFLYS